ncbi:DUF6526 family protein [Lutibacter sp. A64]|uniref:DUF6526 family protein n=1 Tax=Lutibacter sp. A64 TaxID=2918526 RepID=UPI001F06C523|nr:DUF6526 family protein [Lutibacter sp. A64]UMB54015.1 DUF6526 family protein [Lutibacter sp. A64]
MKNQNYKSHSRLVFGFHGILFVLIVALLIGSFRNLMKSDVSTTYGAYLLVFIPFILFFMMYYIRAFALKAQDRAIRAEEKLRYFILTGNTMPDKITTRQIIGLRFASDDEFVALVDRVLNENLSEKEIKKAINNWKPDTYRV